MLQTRTQQTVVKIETTITSCDMSLAFRRQQSAYYMPTHPPIL